MKLPRTPALHTTSHCPECEVKSLWGKDLRFTSHFSAGERGWGVDEPGFAPERWALCGDLAGVVEARPALPDDGRRQIVRIVAEATAGRD